jgi:hypothetical protein
VFNKPDKRIELPVIRFVMGVFDSGNDAFFAKSDQKMLFQILVSHMEEIVYNPDDPVLLALLECYYSMLEWEGYASERYYNAEGQAQLETLLSSIDKDHPLFKKATGVAAMLAKYE